MEPGQSRHFFIVIPLFADFEEHLRVVRDDAIQVLLDTPCHQIFLVYRPRKQMAARSFDVFHEPASTWPIQTDLQHIERDVGHLEVVPGVASVEANVANRMVRQITKA